MSDSLSSVEKAAREAFPDADISEIMALLNTYGTTPHERERERVQLTIIRVCQGDPKKIHYQIDMAKVDYRDILVLANRPIPTPEEGAKLQAAVRDVLDHWNSSGELR